MVSIVKIKNLHLLLHKKKNIYDRPTSNGCTYLIIFCIVKEKKTIILSPYLSTF